MKSPAKKDTGSRSGVRATASVALSLLLVTTNLSQASTSEITTTYEPCLRPASHSSPVWVGEPNANMIAAALDLSALVDAEPSLFAEIEYCSDYSGLTVYSTDATPKTLSKVREVGSRHGVNNISVSVVPFARTALDAAVSAITAAPSNYGASHLSQIAANPITGTIEISDPHLRATRSSTPRRKDVLGIPIALSAGVQVESAAGRMSDTAPFTSGSRIYSDGIACSLGVRVKINGTYRALTAGHCTPSGKWRTSANSVVGSQMTTAWPGNAVRYGDWKVLYGNLNGHVWSGGVNSTSRLAPWGINWTRLPRGHKVCSSGHATGQKCNLAVLTSGSKITIEDAGKPGVEVGRTTYLVTTSGTCDGFNKGDSGGPMYYNDGRNRMVYVGLVSAKATKCTNQYYMTEIGGVRAWNSTATW